MLTRTDLEKNISATEDLGNGVFRCGVKLPKRIFYYWFKLAEHGVSDWDFMVVSNNVADDCFARLVIERAFRPSAAQELTVAILPKNQYGFSKFVMAPMKYHVQLMGLGLDDKRDRLIWCIPCYSCEFSGIESIEEFVLLCREVGEPSNWHRQPAPKIRARFRNPRTRQATEGDSFWIVKEQLVYLQLNLLSGVTDGFIEIVNYEGAAMKIQSPLIDQYVLDIEGQQSKWVSKHELFEIVASFLSTGPERFCRFNEAK